MCNVKVFEPGGEVWITRRVKEEVPRREICSFCKGHSKFINDCGKSILCVDCYGRTTMFEDRYLVEKAVVLNFNLEKWIVDRPEHSNFRLIYTVIPRSPFAVEMKMFSENIFETQEVAQVRANFLNQE